MSGAIPPLPNTPSWRGAKFSTGITLPLPLCDIIDQEKKYRQSKDKIKINIKIGRK